jgi:hypothetical protein
VVAGVKHLHERVQAIWRDVRSTIDDCFGDGDREYMRMTNRVTHRGSYHGTLATKREVVFGAIWILRLAGGAIAEVWRSVDDLGCVVQIGGLIGPGAPSALLTRGRSPPVAPIAG